MNKLIKTFLLSLLLIMIFGATSVFADEDIASGNYDGVDWRITSDNTLIIGKDKETQTFNENSRTSKSAYPWDSYRKDLKSVVFEGKVVGKGSMAYMFSYCQNLTSLDLTSFDTSQVTNMESMFISCRSLKSLNLSNFDTGQVTNMESMFETMDSITNLDLSKLKTSHVTKMSFMFSYCESLTSINLNGFDTSNVTNMWKMFFNCKSLTTLDLSSFDTSRVTNMCEMFSGCTSLSSLNLSSFNTKNVTDMSYMFECCKSLSALDLRSFDTSNVQEMSMMFSSCSSLKSLNLAHFNTARVSLMWSMFENCSALVSLDLSSFNTSNVEDMSNLFYGCSSITNLDLRSFDTSRVTNMCEMLSGCSSLKTINMSSFNTKNVDIMMGMFKNCSSLKSLDLSNFDTRNTTSMEYMFSGCSLLTDLDLSSFNLVEIYESDEMNCMLEGCSSLSILKTPYNNRYGDVDLPFTMYDSEGNEYSSLPKKIDYSITLYKYKDFDSNYYVLGRDNNAYSNSGIDNYTIEKFLVPFNDDFAKSLRNKGYEVEVCFLKYDWVSSFGINNRVISTEDILYKDGGIAYIQDPHGFTYYTSFYNDLLKGVSKKNKKILIKKMNKLCEGICFGTSHLSILTNEGYLKPFFGDSTYCEMGLPKYNKNSFRDLINYYHLLQHREDYYPDCYTATSNKLNEVLSTISYDEQSLKEGLKGKKVSLELFLELFVSEAKKSQEQKKPFSFNYQWKHNKKFYGHAVVVCGYSFDSEKKEHIIKIYDPNYNDEYQEFRVKQDYSSFSYNHKNPNYNVELRDTYKSLDYYGIDKMCNQNMLPQHGGFRSRSIELYSSGIDEIEANDPYPDVETVLLSVPAFEKCSIMNDSGETLICDGDDYSGDMTIYDFSIVGENEPCIELLVKKSSSFIITDMEPDKKYSFYSSIDDGFYSADTSNADEIILSNKKITIDGENYAFCISQSDNDDENIVEISGCTKGTLSSIPNDKGIISVSLENGTEYIGTEVLSDGESDYKLIEDNIDAFKIEVSNGEVSDKNIVIKDINDYTIDDIAKQTYTGEAITPEVVLGDGYKVLVKDQDYKLEYRNNTNIGTATIIITGVGNYKGTIETSFDIVDDGASEEPCSHVWGAWTITKKATEIAAGEESRTCSVCGETETQVIDRLKPTLSSVKISKLAAGRRSVTVKWKKLSKKKLKKISKIQIQYSTSKDFSKNVKTKYASAKKTSYKIKSLKKGKRYYVRIRAYKKTNGVVHVSKWSSVKNKKAK